jgi:hypothetical protein
MRAVMHGDDEVEPVIEHSGADGGEALVEGHGCASNPVRTAGVAEVGIGEQRIE